jgi:anti-sigma B factor antagonist
MMNTGALIRAVVPLPWSDKRRAATLLAPSAWAHSDHGVGRHQEGTALTVCAGVDLQQLDRYWRFPVSYLAAFRVTVESIEDATLIRVVGEIDATTADQLCMRLDDARQSGETTLLDLAEVRFIDSVGLRVLLEATEKVNRDDWALFIVRPSRVVRRLLEITDTADRLPVVPAAEQSG